MLPPATSVFGLNIRLARAIRLQEADHNVRLLARGILLASHGSEGSAPDGGWLPGDEDSSHSMVSADILEILRCPETRQTLSIADGATLAAVNSRVATGCVRNRAGQPIVEPLAEGLLRADARVLYPVREEIPILLAGEAIAL